MVRIRFPDVRVGQGDSEERGAVGLTVGPKIARQGHRISNANWPG